MDDPKVVWRVNVSPVMTGWGLPLDEYVGAVTPITNGVSIRHAGGCSNDIENWHPTRREALLDAASKIERFIAPAIAQVAKLRAEAGE